MANNVTTREAKLLKDCAGPALFDFVRTSNYNGALLGSVVPVCLAVTLLSTPKLRKQWAFRLFIVALVVFLVPCILKMHMFIKVYEIYDKKGIEVKTIRADPIWTGLNFAAFFPTFFVPFICDCALLCRLLAFHPASITPLKKRIAILAFPLAAHIPRLPLLIAYCCLYGLEGPQSFRFEHAYKPLRVVEGGLQLLVNCYCSAFLLHKTFQYARADFASQSAQKQQANRLRRRLRYLTESILFTFVPTSLAQLGYFITAFVELYPPYKDTQAWTWSQNYLRGFGSVFSLYFGLLAVWWSNIRSLRDEKIGQEQSQPIDERKEDVSLLYWALGPLKPEGDRSVTASKEKYQASTPENATDDISEASQQDARQVTTIRNVSS